MEKPNPKLPFGLGLSQEELLLRMKESARIEKEHHRRVWGMTRKERAPDAPPPQSTSTLILDALAAGPLLTDELNTLVPVKAAQMKILLRRMHADGLVTKTWRKRGNTRTILWTRVNPSS